MQLGIWEIYNPDEMKRQNQIGGFNNIKKSKISVTYISFTWFSIRHIKTNIKPIQTFIHFFLYLQEKFNEIFLLSCYYPVAQISTVKLGEIDGSLQNKSIAWCIRESLLHIISQKNEELNDSFFTCFTQKVELNPWTVFFFPML